MTRYLKVLFVLNFILTAHAGRSQENDLLNIKNTESFARYLFESKQYKFAAQEFERLIFLDPGNTWYKKDLLVSYRNAGDYIRGLNKYNQFIHDDEGYENIFLTEYVKLNILGGFTDSIRSLLQNLDDLNPDKPNIDLTYRLISKNWDGLPAEDSQLYDRGLVQLSAEIKDIRYKSPFLAGTFSTIIPGTGKIYTGRWKDGLISFIFVGATAFQSYRGFNKKGTDSVYGWILGGISFGFYVGNIYGSVKSAKIYNTNLQDSYVKRAGDYFINKY